ncbi:MAG: hypothetical protein QNJ65_15545 [Xenococcaceae cyanobacterium MO_234.B1]|nr:hypothetical protein [Xenococcaceae cyanobacterium MO_234.B1]
MASIQIVELHPVENQIEDLSYDMTDIIRGGGIPEAYKCLFKGIEEVFEAYIEGQSSDEILGIWTNTLTCVVKELTAF